MLGHRRPRSQPRHAHGLVHRRRRETVPRRPGNGWHHGARLYDTADVYALDRLTTPPDQRGDKIARFRALFDTVQPDILAIRDNLRTPPHRCEGVFSFADEHHVGILISKPLGQGLLTGTYRADVPRQLGTGDHRLRKRWFQPDAIEIINTGLDRVRAVVGPHTEDLIRVALWGCLDRSPHAVALVGFTTPDQVAMNLRSLSPRPDAAETAAARAIMADIQARLNAAVLGVEPSLETGDHVLPGN